MRRLFTFYLGIAIVLIFPYPTSAETDTGDPWNELNRTSDLILQLVKQENFEQAKKELNYFSEQFLQMDFKGEGLTMNDLRTVTLSIEKAEEALTAAELEFTDRIMHVTSFRLAVDALSSEFHPLWLYTEESVMGALQKMIESLQVEERQQFQLALNEFLRQYQMIRPALLIDLTPEQLTRVESQVKYLETLRKEANNLNILTNHLETIVQEWEQLYQQVKEESSDPSFLWVMFTIGGMIFFTLIYVGWRKYTAEKEMSAKIRAKE
ncbi:sporulation protein YpjB [Alkalihalobacillus alcalophilus ATCC 27647 = CGMCC 1.3604]|uniref:Sporulation protein n=1 Tax=Alkalihalobacillus alcalophilus ATCC 27647 = CGMCC 1.3604 TaxID=1218173 RepID=A0A094WSR8_ALKAL|nr:sporulation protein YpjB [Alkalihalobacillus alcalophilus]KGA99123.1 sporulation protein [Alkalihalobacillus alcalophilus ATCC 27647 = CGMCC 1.3604]MED1563453.1 sporulation protein YpjB [Alkalihalobacillus alcalophilus]THG90326.1 sporulation protein YpjB [Alkalihalobacillus alcalophilus ATCC 27647 = CGMCC 1.3604]